jgi:hypothetical protein
MMRTRRNGCVAGVVLALAVQAWTADAGTVALWRFEPGALTTDSSGNGHPLTGSGAFVTNDVPTFTQGGQTYNTPDVAGAVPLIDQIVHIGMRNGTQYPFVGYLDELRVISQILTPDPFLNAPPKGTTILIQ